MSIVPCKGWNPGWRLIDSTSYPAEIAEAALAHAAKKKTGAAHRRSDLFEKRRKLMEGWGAGIMPTWEPPAR